MKYVMLILNTEAVGQLTAEEQQAWYSEIFAWYEKYGASGALADGGQQLQGPETARTIRSGSVKTGRSSSPRKCSAATRCWRRLRMTMRSTSPGRGRAWIEA